MKILCKTRGTTKAMSLEHSILENGRCPKTRNHASAQIMILISAEKCITQLQKSRRRRKEKTFSNIIENHLKTTLWTTSKYACTGGGQNNANFWCFVKYFRQY